MSTHTPGPWRINDTVASNRFALEIEAGPEGDPFTVCCIEDGTQWVDEDEAMAAEQRDVANAKLIAAAPDLLEACKRALWWLSGDYPDLPVTAQAREAIRKAEQP